MSKLDTQMLWGGVLGTHDTSALGSSSYHIIGDLSVSGSAETRVGWGREWGWEISRAKGDRRDERQWRNLIFVVFEKTLSTGHFSLVIPSSQTPLSSLQISDIDAFNLCQSKFPSTSTEEWPTSLDIWFPTGWAKLDTGKLVSCSLPFMSPEESCCQPIGKLRSRRRMGSHLS